ncbi:unnamed protein product [Cylicostephanus goldi]|uniref:Uncharacterized protein n=1 Tax=Cylicostephanus goldi TaxID=71465 RepID=A0A3P7MAD6_CYLGO|nr:unnamed protein product [Cylicostephanus goldi]
MLENIVAWVLNNYIGEYLEDLNTDQLSVALLSGKIFFLSDVLIIVGPPTPDRRYDVEAVERVEQQKKEQMLDELEKRHTVSKQDDLILNNVHIRYEDDLSLPNGLVFNCGVRIQTMTMQTTNAAGDILAPEDPSSAFIIHPCSAELRMERNSSKFPLKGHTPRFKFFLLPEKITIEMTRRQMAELRALNREWARFERARQHRKWRPLTKIGENAGEWWRFAYDRVSEDTRRAQARRSWHFALTRARHLNAYCRAYRRRLLALIENPALKNSTAEKVEEDNTQSSSSKQGSPVHGPHEDVVIMKQIEHDSQYTYHELHLFRETVFRKLMREKAKEKGTDLSSTNDDVFENIDTPVEEIPSVEVMRSVQKESGGLYGWITSFFMQEESKIEKEEAFDFRKLDLKDFGDLPKSFNVKEMEEEILDVLHESWDDSTLLRRDMLLAEIAMRLEHMTLRFIDTIVSPTIVLCLSGHEKLNQAEQRRVLAMDLTGVTSRVELSPRQHSLTVSLAVMDMGIQRLRTGHLPPKVSSLSCFSFFSHCASHFIGWSCI